MTFIRYCVIALMAVLCTEQVTAMRIAQQFFRRTGSRARVAAHGVPPWVKTCVMGAATAAVVKTSDTATRKIIKKWDARYGKRPVAHVTPFRFNPLIVYNSKMYWEKQYRIFLEQYGEKDPEQKYQDEFQAVVKIFKEKGLLAESSVLFLKLMGPQAVDVFRKNGWVLYGNAFVGRDQDHFLHAHQTLLSELFSPDERIARFAHELVHVAITQNPKIRILLPKQKWEEFVCDVVSVVALQKADGASKLMRHHIAVIGDTKQPTHPKPSTRAAYFDALGPWVQPVDDDQMHELIEKMAKNYID